jgi:hypothetical protein
VIVKPQACIETDLRFFTFYKCQAFDFIDETRQSAITGFTDFFILNQ